MDGVEGWDVHYLNGAMVEMLEREVVKTSEMLETDALARLVECLRVN